MTEQQLQEIEIRARLAEKESRDLCQREHGWRMSIPVQDTDSDLVIGASIHDVSTLVAEVRRLRSELNEARGEHSMTREIAADLEAEVRRLQEIETRASEVNNALLTAIQAMMPFLTDEVQQRFQEYLQPVIDLMEGKKTDA